MKKQIIVLAFIAIAASMTACQWDSMKKTTTSTDSTMVIDTAMPIIDTVTLESDSAK
jgi:hypothetical protein